MSDLGARRCDSMSSNPIRLAPAPARGARGGQRYRDEATARLETAPAPRRDRARRGENDDLATTSTRGTRLAPFI
jgi:hypothetical protein